MNNRNILRLNDTEYYNQIKVKEEEKNYNYMNNSINNDQEFSNMNQPIPEEKEISEERKFFKDFNFPEIDNKDPSLGDNLLKIYEEEIPFEIRYEDENIPENERNIFQNLICKIL